MNSCGNCKHYCGGFNGLCEDSGEPTNCDGYCGSYSETSICNKLSNAKQMVLDKEFMEKWCKILDDNETNDLWDLLTKEHFTADEVDYIFVAVLDYHEEKFLRNHVA